MLDLYLSSEFFPFTLSLALLLGLLALEILFLMIGGSLVGGEGAEVPELDGPDFDLDVDFDVVDLDVADLDLGDLDVGDAEALDGANASGGIADWLGFGRMPAAI